MKTLLHFCFRKWLRTSLSLVIDLQGKYFFKKLSLVLKKERLCILLADYSVLNSIIQGLIWKDTAEVHFCRIFKNKIVFSTNGGAEETPNLVLHNIFYSKYLLLVLLMQSKHCVVSVPNSNEKLHRRLHHKRCSRNRDDA